MFLAVFLTSNDSVFESIPSLFKVVNYEPGVTLIWSIIKFSGFYILCIRKMKKRRIN
jgi:uncharacterized protein